MKDFKKICMELSDTFSKIPYENGDISDIGNEIGIIIAKYFDEENDLLSFSHGLKHGISLTDGTHG